MKNHFSHSIYVKSYLVRIKFRKDITFHFYHGSKLYGLVSRLTEFHPTPETEKKTNDIIIYPVETGRINYSAGDEYNFGIIFLKNDTELIKKFKKNLKQIPESDYPGDLTNDTVEYVSIKEIKLPRTFKNSKSRTFTLKFITPLRIERKIEDKTKYEHYFDPHYFSLDQFLKLLYKRISDLYKLNKGEFPLSEIPVNPQAEIIDKYFIWVDMPSARKVMGGIMGYIKFKAELNEFWQTLLWFGQFTNIGRSTAFGFGKYIWTDNAVTQNEIKPVKNCIELAADNMNLITAFNHITISSESPGTDGITPEKFALNLYKNLQVVQDELLNEKYEPADLLGILIPKPDTKIRALAIPTVKDRIVQRAVTQILSESIDHLLEENSFAYRKGLSRIGAAQAIRTAQKEGFHYVIESDVESFFDNVAWEILFKKIEIIFFNDPIADLLKKWVKSNVIFNRITIKRTKGLPQGGAISPLLANLYLDDFDEALQDEFKLVRYADDFVILCKSKEQAEDALIKVKEELSKLKLNIKASKTRITDFDGGFQYLGYLFVKSMIIEKKKEELPAAQKTFKEESIPAGSWLSLIDFKDIKPIPEVPVKEIQTVSISSVFETFLDKYPLYITEDAYLHIDNNSLEVIIENEEKDKRINYPLKNLSHVVIIGRSRATIPVLMILNEKEIPVYFCYPDGELRLPVSLHNPDYDLWFNQLSLAKNDNFILAFSSEVVKTKINNHKVIARRSTGGDVYTDKFNILLKKAELCKNIESLRGIEGASAIAFYDFLRTTLPAEWKFVKRTKNPPLDPVNAMLSFGYTILYNYIATALQVEGLNPQIGFYHKPSKRYYPLSSDLQEEFRHIIDSLVIYMIHRNMTAPEDFEINEKAKYPCLMSKQFKKKYISIIEERLKTEFTPAGLSKKIDYKKFIHYQVRILKKSILTKEMKYKPLWIR